jgi:menaquinone-dependent protoporphyrinogen IX oxidase
MPKSQKIVIAYKSILGTTKEYAYWLQDALENSDVFSFRELKRKPLTNYDVIIIMSGTYAGRMPLVKFLKKNWTRIENKIVIIIAVGAASEEDAATKEAYSHVPAEIRKKVKYFKLPGRIGKIKKSDVKKEQLKQIIEYLKNIQSK